MTGTTKGQRARPGFAIGVVEAGVTHANSRVRARDRELFEAARVAEDDAQALLAGAHPAEVRGVIEAIRRAGDTRTTGPTREALRDLARNLAHTPSLRVFEAADRLYWEAIMGWQGLLVKRAKRRAKVTDIPYRYLLGVYYEGAFRAALRFDPSRDISFGTYLPNWLMAAEIRDIEQTTTVHRPLSDGVHKARLPVLWMSAPLSSVNGDEDDRCVSDLLTHEAPLVNELIEAHEALRQLDELDQVLPHQQRKILRLLRETGDGAEVARRLGVSRQFVSLTLLGVRAKVAPFRDDFCAKSMRVWCRWPKCSTWACSRQHGLCEQHLKTAEARGVLGVFVGRVPDVAEVEEAAGAVRARGRS